MAIIPINAPTLTINFTATSTRFLLPVGSGKNLRISSEGTSGAVVKTGDNTVSVTLPVSGTIAEQSFLTARSERILEHDINHTHIAVMAVDGGTGTLYVQITNGDE